MEEIRKQKERPRLKNRLMKIKPEQKLNSEWRSIEIKYLIIFIILICQSQKHPRTRQNNKKVEDFYK